MTELATNGTDTSDIENVQLSELDMLKTRARMMGINFSNNIGLPALKAKVEAKMEGQEIPVDATDNEGQDPVINALDPSAPAVNKTETIQELRTRLMAEELKLVRIRITNLDPKKKDLPGEIICVGNEIIGTIRKFVPFGEVTDNGYHVPNIIYKELEARRFLNIRTSKKAGQIKVENGWAKEFAIEVLPALSPVELARLAASQAAGNNID